MGGRNSGVVALAAVVVTCAISLGVAAVGSEIACNAQVDRPLIVEADARWQGTAYGCTLTLSNGRTLRTEPLSWPTSAQLRRALSRKRTAEQEAMTP